MGSIGKCLWGVFWCIVLASQTLVLSAEKQEQKNRVTLSIEDFIQAAEHNSTILAKSQAQKQSLIYEGKFARSWNSPYLDFTSQQTKSPAGGKEQESEIYVMIAPRLPWVSSILRQMYKTRYERQSKSYELSKILTIIGLKRMYLEYLAQKEQFDVYKNRLNNAKEQLDIAKVRYDAGRISKSQYLFFRSDYLGVQVMFENSKRLVLNSLNSLRVALGLSREVEDIEVSGLNFDYLDSTSLNIESSIQNSLYMDIVTLDIKDFENMAKAASRSRLDAIEVGVGTIVGESNNGIGVKVKIPIPLTTRYGNQKSMYLALQSGSMREREILENTLQNTAYSYLEQLDSKRKAITLAKNDEDNKRELSQINKIGYEAGKTSVFEYLTIRNNHLDSMIYTIEMKKEYINTLAMLEESLAQVLNLPLYNLTPKE
ncbi:TolC family protein [Helicobacter sp. 23-1048]